MPNIISICSTYINVKFEQSSTVSSYLQVQHDFVISVFFFLCEQLHMVHYNAKYGDAKNASKYMDGTVALSILFEVSQLMAL